MAERALTDIKGGTVKGQKQVATVVPDVDETTVRKGEEVNKGDFSDEEWESLKASGAVTEDPKDLRRPQTYKASSVQQRAHEEAITARGEVPEPQDDTNPEKAQSNEDTNKQAAENARKTREAEREFDEKLNSDPDFAADLLEGYEDQPRQHQAVLHTAKQEFVAEKVYGDEGRTTAGRKKTTARKNDEPKGGE